MRAVVAALLLTWGAFAPAAEILGWRRDGSGVWPDASPPTTWDARGPYVWSTTLPDWSNASPVVSGGKVCVAVEPTTLTCLDAATGTIAWSAPHDVASAVPAEQRAAILATIARLDAWEAELRQVRAEYGRTLKEARTTGSAEVAARAETLARRTDELRVRMAAEHDPRTPPDQDMVGWSSPTPVADGVRVFALFANGVVAGHDLATGRPLWSRWQGRPPDRMLGWDEGHASSPVLVDGVLIVPFRRLTGLDATTGKVLWEGEDWPHYGSPTPLIVDGVGMVVTPSGRVLRARDGRVLREGLADQWYVGPVVSGRTIYLLEARSDVILRQEGGARVVAWRVDRADATSVSASRLWERRLPGARTFYAAPVPAGSELHLVTSDGLLWTLDAATGSVRSQVELPGVKLSTLYASPTLAGGHLYFTTEAGVTVVTTTGATPSVVATNAGWPTRASPAFVGSRAYLRTRGGVVVLGR